jgi:hypothetical protein
MRKPISFIVLLFLAAFTVTNAINVPIERNLNSSSGSRQRAPMIIPVTVDLSATDLYFYFTSSVGEATITLTDSNGSIVDLQLLDTDTTNELYIPVDGLEAGDYTFTISYGSITLNGSFAIE